MSLRIAGTRIGTAVRVELRTVEVTAVMGAKVLERFPAGAPRGSWPAEEYAVKSDAFLVVVPSRDEE